MPWRLVQFIVVFLIFFLFIMLNIANKCDISFGFAVIEDVPVFLTAFFSFIVGMVCTFPFILGLKSRKKDQALPKERKLGQKPDKPDEGSTDSGHYGID